MPKEKSQSKLNPKQERFCQLYATDKEFFANGVESYIEVYKPKKLGNWYKTARSSASQLLTNMNILKRIDKLLEMKGLNNSYVDKRLAFWITQTAYPTASLEGIKEYNKLKQRIIEKMQPEPKPQITFNLLKIDLDNLPFSDLLKLASQQKNARLYGFTKKKNTAKRTL